MIRCVHLNQMDLLYFTLIVLEFGTFRYALSFFKYWAGQEFHSGFSIIV